MEEKYEKAVSSCNSLKDIRDTISMPGLKEALMDSIEPVKALLNSVFMRSKLKEKPFLNFASASDHELEAFFSTLEDLDANITRNDRSKECVSGRPSLRELMKQNKKCGKQECSILQATSPTRRFF